ncbi:hypothetical protein DFJ74DRAFT_679418 [Hyaloraphidium curvatum]|nr:hypothetical protein DFJ74DRAFT_679418 [Hyaloraphidium curvatum]
MSRPEIVAVDAEQTGATATSTPPTAATNGKASGAAGTTWAQLAKGVKPAPAAEGKAAGSVDETARPLSPLSQDSTKIANGVANGDAGRAVIVEDADASPSDGNASASPKAAGPAPAFVPAPPPVNVWKVRMQQQHTPGTVPSGEETSPGSAPVSSFQEELGRDAFFGRASKSDPLTVWPGLADAASSNGPAPSSASDLTSSVSVAASKALPGWKDPSASKKKQWTPLEVDIKVRNASYPSQASDNVITFQYKDPPAAAQYKDSQVKGKRTASFAVSSHSRQRSESGAQSANAASALSDGGSQPVADQYGEDQYASMSRAQADAGMLNDSTITEHHHVDGHEVTIRKLVSPAVLDAIRGNGGSPGGQASGSFEGSNDGESLDEGNEMKFQATGDGSADVNPNIGYFHRGGPQYRGNLFPPQPPPNHRGRTFAPTFSANRSGSNLGGPVPSAAFGGSSSSFGSRRNPNGPFEGASKGQSSSALLTPGQPTNQSRRAASLPPRSSPGGAAQNGAKGAGTNPNQSMTPGRKTAGNGNSSFSPSGRGGQFSGAAGSAPSSPQGSPSAQFYNTYNNYYYQNSYGYGGYPYGQDFAAASASTYLADPSWYSTAALTSQHVLMFLKAQIEWYFSVENLVKDLYLRRNMDAAGWIDAKVIGQFRRIVGWMEHLLVLENHLEGPADDPWTLDRLVESVEGSEFVEVLVRDEDSGSGPKFRKREDWDKWLLPQPAASTAESDYTLTNPEDGAADTGSAALSDAADVAMQEEAPVASDEAVLATRGDSGLGAAETGADLVVNVEEAEAQVLVEEVAFVSKDPGPADGRPVAANESAKVAEEVFQSSLENAFVDHDTDGKQHGRADAEFGGATDGQSMPDQETLTPRERKLDGPEATSDVVDEGAEEGFAFNGDKGDQPPADKARTSWAAAVSAKPAAEAAGVPPTEFSPLEPVSPSPDEGEKTPIESATDANANGTAESTAENSEDEGWQTVNTKKTKKVEKGYSSYRGKRGSGFGIRRGGSRPAPQVDTTVAEDDDRFEWRKRGTQKRRSQQQSPRTLEASANGSDLGDVAAQDA